jgi:hypothetical protein
MRVFPHRNFHDFRRLTLPKRNALVWRYVRSMRDIDSEAGSPDFMTSPLFSIAMTDLGGGAMVL